MILKIHGPISLFQCINPLSRHGSIGPKQSIIAYFFSTYLLDRIDRITNDQRNSYKSVNKLLALVTLELIHANTSSSRVHLGCTIYLPKGRGTQDYHYRFMI